MQPVMTLGRDDKGRMLAIISRGGHPQRLGSGQCEVLDVEIVKSPKHAKRWFQQQLIAKPWEQAND